ncbi:MAG: FkbM family methyltransferase [Clostridia bacterium]|nr:FkbM family methyltransferase [Clostridia bacterium]
MINYKKYIFDGFGCDVWHTLKDSKKPILIYGMGNGADKIISVFEKYIIEYSDVFASDGFVRGHSYRGKRVLSYSEACEKYAGDFDIVVSFGSKLPEVIDRIEALEENHRVFLPDVPIFWDALFCEEFFDEHINEILSARELFSDEESKEIFDNVLKFKLSGKLKYLKIASKSERECDEILEVNSYKSYLDLGAYNGDTVKKYLSLCPNINKVYAVEPDTKTFKRLKKYADGAGVEIELFNAAAYSHDTTLFFNESGNRNSTAVSTASYEHKTVEVKAIAPDSITESVDFIKYDVEGLEAESLIGTKNLIKNCSPDLLVSAYHKSEDIFKLPQLVKELNPNYKLYLRRLPYIPAWDLNLYAISPK